MEEDRLVLEVKQVIDEFDPEGLIALGLPVDEYIAEASELARRLKEGQVMSGAVIEQYWVKRFYPECSMVKLGMAGELAARLNQLTVN